MFLWQLRIAYECTHALTPHRHILLLQLTVACLCCFRENAFLCAGTYFLPEWDVAPNIIYQYGKRSQPGLRRPSTVSMLGPTERKGCYAMLQQLNNAVTCAQYSPHTYLSQHSRRSTHVHTNWLSHAHTKRVIIRSCSAAHVILALPGAARGVYIYVYM